MWLTKLDDDLAKVIGMSGPRKESLVADGRLVTVSRLEQIFLYVTDTLHNHANRIQNDARNVPARPKVWLRVLCDIRGV